MKFLLDTNICIYILNNKYLKIIDHMDQVGIENLYISSITIAELEFGIAKSQRAQEVEQKLFEFLIPFNICDFDFNAARQYGWLRKVLESKGKPIGQMDLQIAAIALANEMTVVTNNVREFKRMPNLKVENWVK